MAHLSGHLKNPKWPRKNLLGLSGSLGRALGCHIVNPQRHWPSLEAQKSLPLPRKIMGLPLTRSGLEQSEMEAGQPRRGDRGSNASA